MGINVSIEGFSGKNSPEFKKHFNAVQFCIENKLSYPKETSQFFKGKVQGGNLEDYNNEYVIKYIENGVKVGLKIAAKNHKYIIKVSDIPKEVDEIIISLE